MSIEVTIERAKRTRQETREKRFAERIRSFFPDGFKNLPKGFQFKPDDPQLELLSAISSPNGENLLIQVEAVIYDRDGRKRHVYAKYSLHNEGRITSDRVQQIPGLDPMVVIEELLEKAERIELTQWRQTSFDLNPVPVSQQGKGFARESLEPADPEKQGPDTDLDRLAFLANLPEVLAMSVDGRAGLQGYRLFLFPRGAILESPFVENAIYIIHFQDEIPRTKRELRTVSDEEVDDLIRGRQGSEAIFMPKQERARQRNVRRFNHLGDWRGRVLSEVAVMSKRERV